MAEKELAKALKSAGVSWLEVFDPTANELRVHYTVNYTSISPQEQFGIWSALPKNALEAPTRFYSKCITFAKPHPTKSSALTEMLARVILGPDGKPVLNGEGQEQSVWDENELKTLHAALAAATKPPPETNKRKRRGVMTVAAGTSIDITKPNLTPKEAETALKQEADSVAAVKAAAAARKEAEKATKNAPTPPTAPPATTPPPAQTAATKDDKKTSGKKETAKA